METSLNTKQQTVVKQPVSMAKSSIIFSLITVLLLIGFILFANIQSNSIIEGKMMNELKSTGTISFEHVGGTEQIKFYLVKANNEEYIVRMSPLFIIIDSFNLSERPEAGQYFKQHYTVNW